VAGQDGGIWGRVGQGGEGAQLSGRCCLMEVWVQLGNSCHPTLLLNTMCPSVLPVPVPLPKARRCVCAWPGRPSPAAPSPHSRWVDLHPPICPYLALALALAQGC
jgi:hypothetical protein